MKTSRFKSLLVASSLSVLLAACGSSGDGTTEQPPVGEDPPAYQPGPIVQAPQDVDVAPQADEPQGEEPKGEEPKDEVPKGEPLPVEGQTGWALGDDEGIETRNPVELLLAATCVGRAKMEMQPVPESAEACRTTYPDILPGGEKPWLQYMASMQQVELVEREGCTYAPQEQVAYCGWTFTKFYSEVNENHTLGMLAPFVPTFTPFVDQCAADKPHYVSAEAVEYVSNEGPVPSGCLGWSELMQILDAQHSYGLMRFDENGFPLM
jgi:hypothetical protein